MISLFQLRIDRIFVIFECESLIAYTVILLPIPTVLAVSMGFFNFKSNMQGDLKSKQLNFV